MAIKVLIVDDSALIRQLLTEILCSDPEIEVVGTASDPLIAREKVLRLNPDVITLDVEMPRMDGISFLEKLMRARPTPVLMISSLTERNCDITLRALELGAIDFITKPKVDIKTETFCKADEIIAKVKMASKACVRKARPIPQKANHEPEPTALYFKTTHKVIAIGASTGGTEAIVQVLTRLPADSPGIVMVQHMPEGFTRSFAARLDSLCKIRVKEAEDGDRILPGHALLAPGNFHMEVLRSGAISRVRVFSAEPVNRHRPSVDVLFHSCAKMLGKNAVGVILTGMGNDGARGLSAMRQTGARTIAQNEETCVVFGMPKEAILLGGAEEILPLDDVAQAALRLSAS